MPNTTPQTLNEAYTALTEAQRILIVAHQKPDGDAAGSSLALWQWLDGLDKDAQIYCKHSLHDRFHFLPYADRVKTDPSMFSRQWDVVVICDSGDLSYAGVEELIKEVKNGAVIINFDHHSTNTQFGHHNIVDPTASSTAEVIYAFFKEHSISIDKNIATCLMTAVFTDTNGFSNAATNQKTFEMAAEFSALGASIPEIHRATMSNKEIGVMKLWGKVLSRLSHTKHGFAYTYILQRDFYETDLPTEAIEGLANYLSQLQDAKAVVVLSERDAGTIKVSLRTTRDDIDLSRLAEILGGGGHQKAAGFTVLGRLEFLGDRVRVVG